MKSLCRAVSMILMTVMLLVSGIDTAKAETGIQPWVDRGKCAPVTSVDRGTNLEVGDSCWFDKENGNVVEVNIANVSTSTGAYEITKAVPDSGTGSPCGQQKTDIKTDIKGSTSVLLSCNPNVKYNVTNKSAVSGVRLRVGLYVYTDGINRSAWQETPLDTSNPWRDEDEKRDGLNMQTSNLDKVTRIKQLFTTLPEDGRYIYVYRKSDNTIAVRNYDRLDRDATSEENKKYEESIHSPNCRQDTGFGSFLCKSPQPTGYKNLHVRHSQLNDGWGPVWCAGEMRIGTQSIGGKSEQKICKVNNSSGHFKPKVDCLQYVRESLDRWGVPFLNDPKAFGHYDTVKTREKCW